MLRVSDNIFISRGDITYRFSRSSGPGGQNVNKLNTRVTLLFNIARSRGLTGEQKQLILNRLSSRISDDGILLVVSQRFRTQQANRLAACRRLVDLLGAALKQTPVRKATAVPSAVKKNRLLRKRCRSEIKRLRKAVSLD